MDNEQEKQIKKGKKNKFKKVINITSILMFISFLFLSYSILLISGVETELRYFITYKFNCNIPFKKNN